MEPAKRKRCEKFSLQEMEIMTQAYRRLEKKYIYSSNVEKRRYGTR